MTPTATAPAVQTTVDEPFCWACGRPESDLVDTYRTGDALRRVYHWMAGPLTDEAKALVAETGADTTFDLEDQDDPRAWAVGWNEMAATTSKEVNCQRCAELDERHYHRSKGDVLAQVLAREAARAACPDGHTVLVTGRPDDPNLDSFDRLGRYEGDYHGDPFVEEYVAVPADLAARVCRAVNERAEPDSDPSTFYWTDLAPIPTPQ